MHGRQQLEGLGGWRACLTCHAMPCHATPCPFPSVNCTPTLNAVKTHGLPMCGWKPCAADRCAHAPSLVTCLLPCVRDPSTGMPSRRGAVVAARMHGPITQPTPTQWQEHVSPSLHQVPGHANLGPCKIPKADGCLIHTLPVSLLLRCSRNPKALDRTCCFPAATASARSKPALLASSRGSPPTLRLPPPFPAVAVPSVICKAVLSAFVRCFFKERRSCHHLHAVSAAGPCSYSLSVPGSQILSMEEKAHALMPGYAAATS